MASEQVRFSLFYFSAEDAASDADPYRLLIEGARLADRTGLAAVWVPERHFGRFGGVYPNPSVLAAALATVTERVDLRAGSVVAPLHHPARIAEEWAVVDNLSHGRAAISFAPGWAPNDFALAPGAYRNRRDVLVEHVDTVRRLWRGEAVRMIAGDGGERDVTTSPRPVQPELRFWLTSGGFGTRTGTPALAGRLGANLLTHMVSQSPADLATRIDDYRRARAAAGHDPATGCVTLMLHTFVCDDPARHERRIRRSLEHYLGESLDLQSAQGTDAPPSDRHRRIALDLAATRLLRDASLIGTPAECARRAAALRALGVDEIACLVDFGLEAGEALAGIERLAGVQAAVAGMDPALPAGGS